jgi:serine phosphatase RsbU (regulator of sigma subunit)
MLVMLLTRDLVIKHAQRYAQPAELLSAVNRDLRSDLRKGMFVTMFYGILDPASGKFTFASAGHNPLIHVDAATNSCKLVKTSGFPLGMMAAAQFEKRIQPGEIQLSCGDWLVQYTDGVNEARSVSEEEYGMERFLAAVSRSTRLSAGELTGVVLNDISSFVDNASQYDDLTLLALHWTGPRGSAVNGKQYEVRNAVRD